MKMGIYSIVTETENTVLIDIRENNKEAIKAFKEAIKDDQLRKGLSLYRIGTFDSKTGEIRGQKKNLIYREEPVELSENNTSTSGEPMGTEVHSGD